MEIAGYDIDNKYLLYGGIGLGAIFLLTRNKSQPTAPVGYLQPAEGLSWDDIIGQSDDGKLVGPGGPVGVPGPAGPPGLQGDTPGTCKRAGGRCSTATPCCHGLTCQNGVCVARDKHGGGNDKECRRNN